MSKLKNAAAKTVVPVESLISRIFKFVRSLVVGSYRFIESVLFDMLPSTLGVGLAVLLAVAPLILAAYMYNLGQNSVKHPSEYTVMITNLKGTGGGSGVIISNSSSESVVLTNSHVCKGVSIKEVGKVKLVNGNEHLITGIVIDRDHDLCAVSVSADLKNSIKLADSAPEVYSEATITGHPALMPNVITKGHFGGRQIISIIVGARSCRDSDYKDPNMSLYCSFFGLAPIIRQYESQVVTATIMGGSSGSAVLNSDGELSGLVFAGNAEGLSYAYIVPYESVNNFVNGFAKTVQSHLKLSPWLNEENEAFKKEINFRQMSDIVLRKCEESNRKDSEIRKFCEEVKGDIRNL